MAELPEHLQHADLTTIRAYYRKQEDKKTARFTQLANRSDAVQQESYSESATHETDAKRTSDSQIKKTTMDDVSIEVRNKASTSPRSPMSPSEKSLHPERGLLAETIPDNANLKRGAAIPISSSSLSSIKIAKRVKTDGDDFIASATARRSQLPRERGTIVRLQKLLDLIRKRASLADRDLEDLYDQIRTEIHEYEHMDVDRNQVNTSGLLRDHGLRRLFESDANGQLLYPLDIRSDAQILYKKWLRQDFEPDMLRGLKNPVKVREGGKLRQTWTLDDNWMEKHTKIIPTSGHGECVNGQWWPMQICMVRDGAHGSMQGGIHGRGDEGALSIVLSTGSHSGGKYADKDYGNEIYYTGTEGNEGKVSKGTEHLLTNSKRGLPVRVFRSAGIPEGNRYRPDIGFRYDGLYDVLPGPELLDAEKQHFRFHLRRQEGQEPIRYVGKAARPTEQDKLKFREHKVLKNGPS